MVLDDGVCRENCTRTTHNTVYKQWVTIHNQIGKPLKDSVKLEYINICEQTIPGCALAALNVSQNFEIIQYSCERCVQSHFPVIDLDVHG